MTYGNHCRHLNFSTFPEVSLDAPGGVNEGEIANVCLDIVNANLINGTATVTLSTEMDRGE